MSQPSSLLNFTKFQLELTRDDHRAQDRRGELGRTEDEDLGREVSESEEVREERHVVHAVIQYSTVFRH